MSQKQPNRVERMLAAALGALSVLLLLALTHPVPAQSQPGRLLRKTKVRVSGRVPDAPPARTRVSGGGSSWSTTLPKVNNGATITGTRQGSISVGSATLSLRKRASRATPSAALPQNPITSSRTAAGLQANQAQEISHANLLRRQNPRKLSPEARKVRGAAIRGAEDRAGAARARADKARAYEASQSRKQGLQRKKKSAATQPYKRPPNATTRTQRAAMQGKPCVDCGRKAPKMYADHKRPLVKEHYETGRINKRRMRQVSSVQPQCPECSNRQGAKLSRYAREQRNRLKKKNDGSK